MKSEVLNIRIDPALKRELKARTAEYNRIHGTQLTVSAYVILILRQRPQA